MKLINGLFLFFLGTSLFSCGNGSGEKTSDFSLNFTSGETEFQLGDTLEVNAQHKNNQAIDSVVYFFQGTKLKEVSGNENFSHRFQEEKLGKWDLTARIFSQGEQEEIQQQITLYNDTAPITYTYRIVATYPHSSEAYTQGLEFYRDTLYESTGEYGESTVRKVDLQTGNIIQSKELDDTYFGEGLTILNDKVYQLTWQEGEGFIYDPETLERIGNFAYNQSEEGWGLANDGEKLYKSDGTDRIWILNPETLSEEDFIQTADNQRVYSRWNELEWINGKIYANTYQKDGVAIINPQNGAIEGVVNFKGLREELSNTEDLNPVNDVLNGIAYNPITQKIYVTGKNWDKLFEVEIMER